MIKMAFITSFRLHCGEGRERREIGYRETRQSPLTLVPMRSVDGLN